MEFTLEKKLQGFRNIAQEKLQNILCSIPNRKDLIIEADLIKPLEHVCMASWVKSQGVEKIYKFDQNNVPLNENNYVAYMISANLLTFKLVLDQILAHQSKTTQADDFGGLKRYHVIVVPNVYSSFQILLEEEGLHGFVNLHRFNWDFIYLDESVLSLELHSVFNDIFIQRDTSILSSIIQSFRVFSMVAGKPDVIVTFGKHSEKLIEMVDRHQFSGVNDKKGDFEIMLVIDRNKDFPSCLLTPAIYSGLLLEVFKFKAGELTVHLNSNKISNGKLDIFKTPSDQSGSIQNAATVIRMNGTQDEIFGDNRYKNISDASNLVRSQAKVLGLEVQNLNKMKLSEMQEYVSRKLPKITELKNKLTKHLNACEQIIKELAGNFQMLQSLEDDILHNHNRKQILAKIDEILTVEAHKYNTLRLLCLVYVSIGLTSEELSTFIRNYCNIFGYKYLYVFQNLAKAQLLPELETAPKTKLLQNFQLPIFQQTEFQANANKLKLLTPTSADSKSNIDKPCASYVFNGSYIPMTARLAFHLLKAESLDDLSTKLGVLDELRISLDKYSESKTIKELQQAIKRGAFPDPYPLKKRTLFIFVLGGATYAEIAACNLIAQITNSKIVIASNGIYSGSDFISSAFL